MRQRGPEPYETVDPLLCRFDGRVGQNAQRAEKPQLGVGAGDIGATVVAGLGVQLVVEKRAGAAAGKGRSRASPGESHIRGLKGSAGCGDAGRTVRLVIDDAGVANGREREKTAAVREMRGGARQVQAQAAEVRFLEPQAAA